MTLLAANHLTYSIAGRTLVDDASFALKAGTLTALVGANGSGKTTLLRLALGVLAPDQGSTQIGGDDIAGLTPIQRARKIAYLPQTRALAWPQPVRDIVALGRFAFGAVPERLSADDEAAVKHAIAACKLEGFEERAADTLSGGELTRVHLARALAAQTPVLVADEPVAALDPRFAHEALRLFKQTSEAGQAVLTVLHDLTLAAQYADRLIWLKEGSIVADGSPQDTVTSEGMREVFGVLAEVELTDEGRVSLQVTGPA